MPASRRFPKAAARGSVCRAACVSQALLRAEDLRRVLPGTNYIRQALCMEAATRGKRLWEACIRQEPYQEMHIHAKKPEAACIGPG